jgi:RNA polymerase sigma-70 factor (ECF subfamily)
MSPATPAARSYTQDVAVAAAIKDGDEAAFLALVTAHQAGFLRLARLWCGDAAVAEEVVQETWVTALGELAGYQGRASLKTFLCAILHNLARGRRRVEARTVPMSALGDAEEPAVDPSRFSPPGHRWEGHWATPPAPWPESPEGSLARKELRGRLVQAIGELPPAQRDVVVLCDVEGLTGDEACAVLGISAANQRVLLHRARSRLRTALETLYNEGAL